MPFTVERLGDEPIIVLTAVPPVSGEDTADLPQRIAGLMRPEDELVFRIADVREMNLTFGDMVQWLSSETQGDAVPGSMRDPRIRVITVATDDVTRIAVDAAKQDQYHGVEVEMYSTMDEALNSARRQLRAVRR
jgi:hypothetical protein